MNTALRTNPVRKGMIIVVAFIILAISGYVLVVANLPAIEPVSSSTPNTSADANALIDVWLYHAQAEYLADANALVDVWLYNAQTEASAKANAPVDIWLYHAQAEYLADANALIDVWLYNAQTEAAAKAN